MVLMQIFFALLVLKSSRAEFSYNQRLFTTEVFNFTIDRTMFEDFVADSSEQLEFSASLLGKPDLPKRLFLRQLNGSDKAILYGSYQDSGTLNIEFTALNRYNYKTAVVVRSLHVERREKEAQYEVEMKFLNLDVEDLFEGSWLSNLEEIFKKNLWSNSEVIYITKVASVVDIGGRVPVNPKDKEGVVVRIGGNANFSRHLRELEVEANQLRNRVPCPKNYKKTSAEHYFHNKGFETDWCGFRLITLPEYVVGEGMMQFYDIKFSPISLEEDLYRPPLVDHLPRRDFLLDFLLSLAVPTVIMVILVGILTCFMCCSHEGPETRLKSTPSTQLSNYNSIERATNSLRQLTSKRSGNVSLTAQSATPSSAGSSLTHSRAGSPVPGTLPKMLTCNSRMSTLRGGSTLPPPYAPSYKDV